jgi:hypothetical protein
LKRRTAGSAHGDCRGDLFAEDPRGIAREVTADAVREVESHIRERVTAAEAMPNERDALELSPLGEVTASSLR